MNQWAKNVLLIMSGCHSDIFDVQDIAYALIHFMPSDAQDNDKAEELTKTALQFLVDDHLVVGMNGVFGMTKAGHGVVAVLNSPAGHSLSVPV